MGKPVKLAVFDLTQEIPENKVESQANCPIKDNNGSTNGNVKYSIMLLTIFIYTRLIILGMALWMVWHLNEDGDSLCTGPVEEIQIGQDVQWDLHSKQGVHFFPPEKQSGRISNVAVKVAFQPSDGEIEFTFDLV